MAATSVARDFSFGYGPELYLWFNLWEWYYDSGLRLGCT